MPKPRDGILCYDVGGTRCKAGLFLPDEERVVAARIEPTPADYDADSLLEHLIGLGRGMATDGKMNIVAVGFAVTGVADPDDGRVVLMNHLPQLQGVPIGERLKQAFGAPAVIDNDARAYTLGEAMYGSGKGSGTVLGYTLGTGVGCAVVINGKPLRSKGLLAGILGGHFSVDGDGLMCGCGNRGCLEVYASASGLRAAAIDALRREVPSRLRARVDGQLDRLTPAMIFEALAEGDAAAREAFDGFIGRLGAGVVTRIHAYDPDVVVMGGGVIAGDEPVLPPLREYVARHAWTIPKGRVEIRRSALGDDAALYGVAAMARARMPSRGNRK